MIKNEVINEAISYIMERITDEISVEDVAEHCHFSKFYFNRFIQRRDRRKCICLYKAIKTGAKCIPIKGGTAKKCNGYL